MLIYSEYKDGKKQLDQALTSFLLKEKTSWHCQALDGRMRMFGISCEIELQTENY